MSQSTTQTTATGHNPDAWQTLKIGAGGFVTGIDVADDGTKVVRTDVNGAYVYDDATQSWRPLVTANSMANLAGMNDTGGSGVYEIQIAASDSSRVYMTYLGQVYRSDDKGQHWTATSLKPIAADSNDNFRTAGQKMAVDPHDPDTVIVGSSRDGLFITHDGGATWAAVASIPTGDWVASLNCYPGVSGIQFDPGSADASGHSQIAYASSYGNGVYMTTDGGASWTHVDGGPTNVYYSAIAADGTYYAIGDNQSSLWQLEDGHWTLLRTTALNNFTNVAIDPFNNDHVVINISSGTPSESLDGGKTWVDSNGGTTGASADQPGWITTIHGWLSSGGLVFDPVEQGKIWLAAGDGVWQGDTSTPFSQLPDGIHWEVKSAGIEELVANDIVVSTSGHPVLASWDRAFFYVDDADTYATDYSVPNGQKFSAGWSLDYASSDPDFVVGLASWWGSQSSGYSTDGGKTWQTFESYPSTVNIGGSIAASTPDNIIWSPANKQAPYYTLDGGKSWHEIDLPGMDSWDALHWAYYLNRTTVTADRVEPNTFYLYHAQGKEGGVFRTTDGGVSWEKVFSGEISSFSTFNAKIQSVPGDAGGLYFTGGHQDGVGSSGQGFFHSTDGGETWAAVPNVTEVYCFGYGASATPDGPPALFIAGFVGGVYGIWQSDDEGHSWANLGTFPDGNLVSVSTISGDPEVYGQVYVGLAGGGYLYLPGHDPIPPTVVDKSGTAEAISSGSESAVAEPVNHAPDADASQAIAVNAGASSSWAALGATDADNDQLGYVVKTGDGPSRGTVELDQKSGTFRYTADRGAAGTDRFIVEISDGKGGVAEQAIEVTVNKGINTTQLGSGLGVWNESTSGALLEGGDMSDLIYGNAGADTLDGGLNGDSMIGGAGDDTYIVDNIADGILETWNQGTDTVKASIEYRLGNHIENLKLTGSGDIDGHGNQFDNHIVGNSGANALNGNIGDDVLDGGAGADRLFGGSHNDTLYGGDGVDVLNGCGGDDIGYGDAGDDRLYGQEGDDSLYGGEGKDMLKGDAGADRLSGGAGKDMFEYRNASESTTGAMDHILDFNTAEGDVINLRQIDANTDRLGDQRFSWIDTEAFHHVAGELRYEVAEGGALLQGDVNGDGKADFALMIEGITDLANAGNILL